MRRSLYRSIPAGVACAALAVLPAVAAADSPPTVESEAASHVTALDATLEATINPEGAPHGVYYQFQLIPGTSEYLPDFECPTEGFPAGSSLCLGLPSDPGALPIGHIEGGSQGESVHLDLLTAGAKLRPGATYSFRVIVARTVLTEDTIAWEEPIVDGPQQTFTTPPAAAQTSSGSQPSTTSGGGQPGASHPSGSMPPPSPSSGAPPASPLGMSVGSGPKKHGAHKAKSKHRRRRYKRAKHAKHRR
jgi:hypothetical protein